MKPGQKNSYNSLKSINIGEKDYKFPKREDALSNSGVLNDETIEGIDDIIVQFGYRRKFKGTNETHLHNFMIPVRHRSLPRRGLRTKFY